MVFEVTAASQGAVLTWTSMLLGPCMVAAPVVAVAGVLLLPLWPVTIVALAVLRVVFIPVGWLAERAGAQWGRTLSQQLARAFALVLRPWTYFTPRGDPAVSEDEAEG